LFLTSGIFTTGGIKFKKNGKDKAKEKKQEKKEKNREKRTDKKVKSLRKKFCYDLAYF